MSFLPVAETKCVRFYHPEMRHARLPRLCVNDECTCADGKSDDLNHLNIKWLNTSDSPTLAMVGAEACNHFVSLWALDTVFLDSRHNALMWYQLLCECCVQGRLGRCVCSSVFSFYCWEKVTAFFVSMNCLRCPIKQPCWQYTARMPEVPHPWPELSKHTFF